MVKVDLKPGPMDRDSFAFLLQSTIVRFPEDAVVNLKISGRISDAQSSVLRAAYLRSLAPPTMNISIHLT